MTRLTSWLRSLFRPRYVVNNYRKKIVDQGAEIAEMNRRLAHEIGNPNHRAVK